MVLLDDEGRIFAVLAGAPDGVDWDGVTEDATNAMDEVGARLMEDYDGSEDHRRGRYFCLASGFRHGGGPKVRLCLYSLP